MKWLLLLKEISLLLFLGRNAFKYRAGLLGEGFHLFPSPFTNIHSDCAFKKCYYLLFYLIYDKFNEVVFRGAFDVVNVSEMQSI